MSRLQARYRLGLRRGGHRSRGNHAYSLALRIWREERHELLAQIGRKKESAMFWERRYTQLRKEHAACGNRIGELKTGALDPKIVENLRGMNARVDGQRKQIALQENQIARLTAEIETLTAALLDRHNDAARSA